MQSIFFNNFRCLGFIHSFNHFFFYSSFPIFGYKFTSLKRLAHGWCIQYFLLNTCVIRFDKFFINFKLSRNWIIKSYFFDILCLLKVWTVLIFDLNAVLILIRIKKYVQIFLI
ncbi:unnamed protein product [Blepharisma stoltei]|uniref:Uncharacterized protein n=1 Tax=Blepharisma stoltei TaxID=1481888 RepID=A0AAU9JT75_9CILI|nr:unnamed protein product [Blepharisma stoltei]